MSTLVLKCSQVLLSLLVSIVFARVLGVEGFGLYAFAYSLASLLAIPVQFGLPQLVLRETTKAYENNDWAGIRSIWSWSNRVAIGLSVCVVALVGAILWLFPGALGAGRSSALLVATLLIPLLALAGLRRAALRGLHRIVLAQLPDNVLRPLAQLGLLGLVVAMGSSAAISPVTALVLTVAAVAAAYLMGAAFLKAVSPTRIEGGQRSFKSKYWLAAMFPLGLVSGFQLLIGQFDILMLGVIRNDADVGVYRAVVQISLLSMVAMDVAQLLIAPYIIRFHSQGDARRLEKLVMLSSRFVTIANVPLVAVIAIFGSEILEFVFGSEFSVGAQALLILMIGKTLNAALGPVGVILTMTGHAKAVVRSVGLAAISNILLNLLLIPEYGVNGAATATAISLTLSHLLMRRQVRELLGIETSVRIARQPADDGHA